MKFYCCLFIIFIAASCNVQNKITTSERQQLIASIPGIMQQSATQYKLMMKDLDPNRFPRNYDPQGKKFETSNGSWWCSGFYPGTLLFLYQETKDAALLAEAKRIMQVLEKEKHNKGTHDLGFMMYCSFGNANRLEPKKEYDEILMTSAKSLASRFDEKVGCIRSWNSKPEHFVVIIDNMMNLDLLTWATRYSGDSSFYKIAVTHANNTLKNHFRSDNSSYHVIDYNPQTGVAQEKRTAQGNANESAWARGQAWGLYGYTMMYRETKDPAYLQQAKKIAAFMLDHANMPADLIPYWDYNAPGIPNALRDASAAAVAASALLELGGYATTSEKAKFHAAAEKMLVSLSSPTYRASTGTNGGFILQHSVGHLPAKSEVDVALTYADYYYIEALMRYRDLMNN